jgi:hypothetical protein
LRSRKVAGKTWRDACGAADLWELGGEGGERFSFVGGRMREGGIDDGASGPEEVVAGRRCAFAADFLGAHAGLAEEGEGSVGSGGVCESVGVDGYIFGAGGVGRCRGLREAVFVEDSGVGRVGSGGRLGSLGPVCKGLREHGRREGGIERGGNGQR